MSEIDLLNVITQQGFAIAVAIYLLYERTKMNAELTIIIKENTAAMVGLKDVIQKLCELNGDKKK